MATDRDEDVDDIVVDDKPREDGLPSEEEAGTVPESPMRSVLPEQEQIAVAITSILNRLDELADRRLEPEIVVENRVSKAFDDLTSRMDALISRIGGLEERLDDFSSLAPALRVNDDVFEVSGDLESSAAEDAVEAVVSESVNSQLTPHGEKHLIEELVFGQKLCEDSSLDNRRRELLDGVLAHEATAIGLAARLMLVPAAGADGLPLLLKEIGEAYYRKYPKSTDVTDALETSLVKDLGRQIAAVGLRNSIELVRPGDRYDASRHASPDRGVEVCEVRGWAVLRDNGKPLTKASVGLR